MQCDPDARINRVARFRTAVPVLIQICGSPIIQPEIDFLPPPSAVFRQRLASEDEFEMMHLKIQRLGH